LTPIPAQQMDYWKQQLADATEALDLPADHARPVQGDYAGARYPISVFPETAELLMRLAEDQKCDAFVIFLAAFATVLQRYTGNQDIVIGSTASKRLPAARGVV